MRARGPRAWASRGVRAVFSRLPLAGFRPPPPRPAGITAIVRVRNEEEWIEPAVRSLVGFADQVVIGDNGSTDATPAIVRRLAADLPGLVEALAFPGHDICALTNALLARARFRFVIRWDADFVGQTTGEYALAAFRGWLLGLDPRRYYMVYPRMVEITGDFWHQDPVNPTRADAHCWTASPFLRYVENRAGFEAPRVPLFYDVRRWDTPCFFHVNVKSDERMFWSHAWKRYLLDRGRVHEVGADAHEVRAGAHEVGPDAHEMEDYVAGLLAREFGGADLANAARVWAAQWMRRLVPFDASYPSHPELLRPYLARPRYRIVYREGVVVGRETLDVEARP